MILRAAWVVRVTSPPIRDGFVEVTGDRITTVGSWHSIKRPSSSVSDLGDAILTPGLVNPHTHLELTCYAGCLPRGPFWPWIAELVRLRREPGQTERETRAVMDGAWQSLRAGVTCVGDISRRNLAWRALKPMPIRKVCFVELLTLADDPPRDPAELRAAIDQVDEDALLTAGVSPHAPYSVPAEHVREALLIAGERDRPWTMHLAETREEISFLGGDSKALPPMLQALLAERGLAAPRQTPAEYLAGCGGDRMSGALAHLNYVEPRDIDALARARHVAIYCPRAHGFFGHTPHPWRELMRAGVNVSIGTDSAASNEGLSPLDELHFVAQHVADLPPAQELFSMITIVAAKALRLDGSIGSLEVGKFADLAAFACPASIADPVEYLITNPAPALGTWVAGRRVTGAN